VAANSSEAESKVKELLERDDIGIIILTTGVKKMVTDRRLNESISTSILPLVIEIPELGEGVTEEDTLRMLIMRAIGIDITKNV
jgi:vacuolar-type H+-ATPase subunit F/Vma7